MMARTRRLIVLLLIGLIASSAGAQSSRGYPTQPVRIIVPYASGSNGEASLRVLVPELETRLGQRLLIETRPGGAGNVGAAAVARAPADGYTLLLGANNNFTINQHLYKEIGFDPLVAFEPIAILFDVPLLIHVNTRLAARTLAELVAYAKANTDQVNFASSGAGTPPHLGAEMLSQLAGIRMTHVPYRSAAQSQAALLAGDVQVYVGLVAGVQSHVDAGRLRILATAVGQRLAQHPSVPSAAEAGYPTLDVTVWWALVGPRGIPQPAVEAWTQAIKGALGEPVMRERYAQLGVVPVGGSPGALATRITKDAERWGEVIRARGIAVE